MKLVKTAVLLAGTAMVTMAFAASASATVTITAPEKGTTYFGSIHASNEGHVSLKPEQLPIIECESTVEGSVTANGTPASGPVTHLTFTPCTNLWHVTAPAGGTLVVNSLAQVISTGATVEATRIGITCRYRTSNTVVGELTDSDDTNARATIHIHGFIPFHSGSPLCGSGSTTWKGAYLVNKPTKLYLD